MSQSVSYIYQLECEIRQLKKELNLFKTGQIVNIKMDEETKQLKEELSGSRNMVKQLHSDIYNLKEILEQIEKVCKDNIYEVDVKINDLIDSQEKE